MLGFYRRLEPSWRTPPWWPTSTAPKLIRVPWDTERSGEPIVRTAMCRDGLLSDHGARLGQGPEVRPSRSGGYGFASPA